MTDYGLRERSTTPGDYNFIAGRLGFLPDASAVRLGVDIGDGTFGTYNPATRQFTGDAFYSKMTDTANRLLLGKGQPVVITHTVIGEYDPETGLVENTESSVTGVGAIIEWDARQVDGTLIKIGDRRMLLSALNGAGGDLTPPVLGDTVTDEAGVVYTLVAPLKMISPAGTTVLYDCNMRV